MAVLGTDILDALSALFTRVSEAEYASAMTGGAGMKFLDADSSDSAFEVPTYQNYRHFFNRVLTAGMPGALPPVESLYEDWGGHRCGLQHGQGYYLGQAAEHVMSVCDSLDIGLPEGFDATPDHLAILLELNDFLGDHAPVIQAQAFAARHFGWLSDYRSALAERLEGESDASLKQVGAFYRRVLVLIEQAVLEDRVVFDTQGMAQSA